MHGPILQMSTLRPRVRPDKGLEPSLVRLAGPGLPQPRADGHTHCGERHSCCALGITSSGISSPAFSLRHPTLGIEG